MAAAPNLPTRLIVAADGTWCTADGPRGSKSNNLSNIYRISACVKRGECEDTVTGVKFNQVVKYVPGIGSDDDLSYVSKLKDGYFGKKSLDQIEEIYEDCCLLTHPDDEVWLFGFSRGAYSVRAVAGLLHYIGTLKSAGTPQFKKDYRNALKIYERVQKNSQLGSGTIHNFFTESTGRSPKISFVGVFDTVKAVEDQNLYDISFNDSTVHFRQALALNEDRKAMKPEALYPARTMQGDPLIQRSFLQAWFIGAHIDMGGSAEMDGLALYPLQWMFLEVKALGLALEFVGDFQSRVNIDNPLDICFPPKEGDSEITDPAERQAREKKRFWSCTSENKIGVSMQDMRQRHESTAHNGRYQILLNRRKAVLWPKTARTPFTEDGELKGYCSYAPQGTFIHPAVYLVLDEYLHAILNNKAFPDLNLLEDWRWRTLGDLDKLPNQGFWNDRDTFDIEQPHAIRILVTGNTGIGKSTLINRVFGTELTESSNRERGQHNVREEIVDPNRSDIIVHDSGGFEAGDESQIQAVEDFVKEKSETIEMDKRLHAIWFCLETNSSRTKQTATIKLLSAITRYAQDVPIIIVATKKDEFYGIKFTEARKHFKSLDQKVTMDEMDQYALEKLTERLELMETELKEVEGGGFDALVAVSKEDDESIEELTEVTAKFFRDERIRRLYTAAQVARVDLKVDMAIVETMRIYRHILKTATASAYVAYASTASRLAGVVSLCRVLVECFGLPSVGPKVVYQIIKTTVWGDMDSLTLAFAEAIATIGVGGTVFASGIPVWVLTGSINVPIIVPSTARLLLMLSADIILLLIRAFKNTADRCVGQPLVKDVQSAAREYRPISKEVHARAIQLIPKRNPMRCYKTNKIQKGLTEILEEYRTKVLHDLPSHVIERPDSEMSMTDLASEMAEIEESITTTSKEVKKRFPWKRTASMDSETTLVSLKSPTAGTPPMSPALKQSAAPTISEPQI